jgi:chemotaxis protein methyltransferase CheR
MGQARGDRLIVADGIVPLLRDLIHERTGVFFDGNHFDALLDKLEEPARARNCRSILDYYYLLKYDQDGKQEWERVSDALSVQETYFYREMSQIRLLVDVLVPDWFHNQRGPLRIWSAACASGEEPFSLAIALEEAGWGKHPIQILGSDASAAALAKARQGVYRERSFRSLPAELREKYFKATAQGAEIRADIASRAQFRRANLVVHAEVADLATSPIIFCRNVFIYFSPDSIRRTLKEFAAAMPDKGHLFVGASESLLKLTSDFDLEEIQDAFVYVRREREKANPNV